MTAASTRDLTMRIHRAVWKRLPAVVRDGRIGRWYGGVLHDLVCRHANRRQYYGTFFLRNRPQLEQIRRLVDARPARSSLRLAVLGCSSGAEVYSVIWTIRSARPDLDLQVQAVDISPEILEVARRGVYTDANSELEGRSLFERMTEAERQSVFCWDGARGTVKDGLRQGITWHLGDAGDLALVTKLGPQDIVLASNFLCHMDPPAAERCLRNIARLVTPGGHLFVLGVDLDVRARLARELGWEPLPELLREMHDGDPSVRNDWPWNWWGLEPLDERRSDWRLRYAIAFRVPRS